MPSLSPRWNSTNVYQPVFVCIYCLRLQIAGFSFQNFMGFWGHLCVYFCLRPGNLLITPEMTLSGRLSKILVSLIFAIQATRFLSFTLKELSPAEHICIIWTHKLVRNFTPLTSHFQVCMSWPYEQIFANTS